MARWLRAIAAVPLVVVAVSLCGLCLAVVGEPLELVLKAQPGAIRWPLLAVVLAAAGLGVNYLFRASSRRFVRLPTRWRQALSDAVLLIGGFGCLVGATFLILSLTPALALQKEPLRASGGILLAGSAMLVLLRVRASRSLPTPPSPPRSIPKSAAQAIPPKEAAALIARNP